VPVAEPSGEYTVTCSVDLSPLFGKIVSEKEITITRPPADILEQRLGELRSDDYQIRLAAAYDLAHFDDEGERVLPALLSCFGSAEGSLRSAAFNSMGSYPEQIAAHFEFFLKIVRSKKEVDRLRSRAASYLAWHAPIDERVQKALEAANEALKESRYGQSIIHYLNYYRSRANEPSD